MVQYLIPKGTDPLDFNDSAGHLLGRSSSYYDAADVSPGTAIPEVVPWPYYPNDSNGVAYPAGLVGVKMARTLAVPIDPATQSSSVADWPVPVPSVLPAGYTHRWQRDLGFLPGTLDPSTGQGVLAQASHDFTGVSATSVSHRIRRADGLHDYFATIPECRMNGYDSGPSIPSIPGTSTVWSDIPITGWRYIQFEVTWPNSVLNPDILLTVELRCNADGTLGPLHGDTLLQSWASPFSQNTTDTSGFFTSGLQFPLGERRWVELRCVVDNYPTTPSTSESGTTHPFHVRIRAGARVDLPLQFTATGEGALIAPGGIVASKLDALLPT